MRLLHLIDLRNIGGVERLFADFLRYEPPYPVEHQVLLDYPKIAPGLDVAVKGISHIKKIGPFSVPKRPKWLRPLNRERLIRRLAPDLIVVWNQFPDYRGLTGKPPCPVVYYEHGFSWYNHSQNLVDTFFSRVDQVFAVSNAAKRILQLRYGVHTPIEVLHNALRPSLPLPDNISRTLPTGQPLRLGSAARIVPLKCLALLVLAVKTLRDRGVQAEAWIAGDGPQREVLDKLVAQHQLQGSVRFLGLLQNMESFYRDIDICVVPSMHESFSLACVEAQVWGLPVISANIDGLPEANPPEAGGICLQPQWKPAEYQQATQASIDFATLVYDPLTDTLTEPCVLHPEAIADAVNLVTATPEIYAARCTMAAAHARSRTFSTLCDELYQAMQRVLSARSV